MRNGSGVLAALGGAYLAVGFVGSFNENMTAGRGFIALAALIFGNWRPFGAFAAALLFGASTALSFRLATYSDSAAVLFQALPYVLTLIAVAGVIGRPVHLQLPAGRMRSSNHRASLAACSASSRCSRCRPAFGSGRLAGVTLVDAGWAVPVAAFAGIAAMLFARGAMGRIQATLERAGGAGRAGSAGASASRGSASPPPEPSPSASTSCSCGSNTRNSRH